MDKLQALLAWVSPFSRTAIADIKRLSGVTKYGNLAFIQHQSCV
jgi:hypothetical protein